MYTKSGVSLLERVSSVLHPTLGFSGLNVFKQSQTSASRCFSASAPTAPPSYGLIEVREYTVIPAGLASYMEVTTKTAELRKSLLPFLGMFTCDVGGSLLKVTHLYGYKDFDERDEVRAVAAANPEWTAYVKHSRQFISHQESKIMLQAAPVYAALGMPPTQAFVSPTAPAPTAGSSRPAAKVIAADPRVTAVADFTPD
ncbi:MAG: hypothetical protein WDW38_000011 [Sanguina aurantia]